MFLILYILLILYGISVGYYLARAFVRSNLTFKTISILLLLHFIVNIFLILCDRIGWIPQREGYGLHTLNIIFLLAMLCGGVHTIAAWAFINTVDFLKKWLKR